MRRKKAPSKEEPQLPEDNDSDWIALGVHQAFLQYSRIYKRGVQELCRVERLGLPRDQYLTAKAELDEKITKRISEEVGPLMPSSRADPSGSEAFYGVFAEALKTAKRDPQRIERAYGIGLAEFDAENRFLTPFQSIFNGHVAGDRRSSDQYLKLVGNNQLVRYGEGLPAMKGNIDHRIIMKNGLGLGLQKLSASELARFYDAFCPCLVDAHDADDLRKLRKRILEEGRRAREAVTPKFSGSNQRVI
jgi:hypothetical protein